MRSPFFGQGLRMPFSEETPSPVGPRKRGQSLPPPSPLPLSPKALGERGRGEGAGAGFSAGGSAGTASWGAVQPTTARQTAKTVRRYMALDPSWRAAILTRSPGGGGRGPHRTSLPAAAGAVTGLSRGRYAPA